MGNYEYEKDLDVIATEIKQAVNLISCFIDFCNEEGHCEDCETLREAENKALCFIKRISTYRSLIDTAETILLKEHKILESIIDEDPTRAEVA